LKGKHLAFGKYHPERPAQTYHLFLTPSAKNTPFALLNTECMHQNCGIASVSVLEQVKL
jgi:hypothetical protein